MFLELLNQLTDFSDYKFWVLCLLGVMFIIQMAYYLFIFVKIRKNPPLPPQDNDIVPVSVIICARNEQENLKERLESVLTQDYPDYEVIVVNDASTDDTEMILDEFKQKYSNLYVTNIPTDRNFRHGKKLAITIGIKAAKNEWILLTDADCRPYDKNWIKTMSQNFVKDTDIVLGYGGYEQKKGFINKLICYETSFIAMMYITFALKNNAYMGVGRNLAYRKSLFVKSKGFSSHSRLMSGDDDIFVNANAQKNKVRVELRPSGFTFCDPLTTFSAWNKQKQRHFTASEKYKLKHKIQLGLENFSRCAFYLLSIFLMFFPWINLVALAMFLIRYFVFLFVIVKIQSKFLIKGITFVSVIFDFILPYIHLMQLILGKIRKDRLTWK